MARSIHKTITATGNYVIPVDDWITPFNVAWQAILSAGGTTSYSVEYTLDEYLDQPGEGYGVVTAANPTWTAVTSPTMPQTATSNGQFTSPVKAIRIAVTALSGTLTVNVLQPMSIN